MKKYKNEALWRTYLFLVICSVVLSALFLYLEWNDVKHDLGSEQASANNLVSHSMESLLLKNGNLLKLLGERFVELIQQEDMLQVESAMHQALEYNSDLVGLALVSEKGDFIVSTMDHPSDQFPNLLTKKETRESFRDTLNTAQLVMGRTYYADVLKSWVIPIRLRVLHQDGTIAGVIVAGFELGDVHGLWSSDNLPGHMGLVVIREDFYRQYVSFIDEKDYEDWYLNPVPGDYKDFIDDLLRVQTGVTLDDLKNGNQMISVIIPSKQRQLNYATISYDPLFKHFTIIATNLSLLYQSLWGDVLWVLFVFITFNVGLYMIFRLNMKLHVKNERTMQYEIEHDPLTNLPNRRFLIQSFSSWKQKNPEGFALLFIDLNNFKSSNDLHGHTVGDKILCEVADRTAKFFENCICARQGGDEFIVLANTQDKTELSRLGKNYISHLQSPIVVDLLEFTINASIGVAVYPEDGQDLDDLLRKADMAMYEAKKKQLDLCFYSNDIEHKAKRAAEIENALRSAISDKELSLVYQPQLDSQSHVVLGVEALVRWNSKLLGFVPPDQFIAAAEATGQIHDIGLFVLETALKECVDVWEQNESKGYKLRISVNVSVRQLLADDFVMIIRRLIEEYSAKPITLMIEVTESLFIEDLNKAKDVLNQVAELGVFTSLDDFGTGYSSLSVLSKLPINELKIDRSFVNDIMTDQQDWLLAKSIINLSKSLSIPVVAEGVETKEQADLLSANGCDLFQGYYFARPMPKEELQKFLAQV
jgi:diguanylate cyclase (GGDEF)-like protein